MRRGPETPRPQDPETPRPRTRRVPDGVRRGVAAAPRAHSGASRGRPPSAPLRPPAPCSGIGAGHARAGHRTRARAAGGRKWPRALGRSRAPASPPGTVRRRTDRGDPGALASDSSKTPRRKPEGSPGPSDGARRIRGHAAGRRVGPSGRATPGGKEGGDERRDRTDRIRTPRTRTQDPMPAPVAGLSRGRTGTGVPVGDGPETRTWMEGRGGGGAKAEAGPTVRHDGGARWRESARTEALAKGDRPRTQSLRAGSSRAGSARTQSPRHDGRGDRVSCTCTRRPGMRRRDAAACARRTGRSVPLRWWWWWPSCRR